jgi:cyclopropane-fatty-acyl-phospholipid synthase
MSSASAKSSVLISQTGIKRDIPLHADEGIIDRRARKTLLNHLRYIERGRLVIDDEGELHVFGEAADKTDLLAHINIHHFTAWRDILLRGSIGAGEAYMLGAWTTPDLTKVIRIFSANLEVLDAVDGRRGSLRRFMVNVGTLTIRAYHAMRANTKDGSRGNISAHYDLGNEFFELFLDPTMMYSSAVFPDEKSSLEDASLNKLDRICKKLHLNAADHLIEIGTGWGGLAIYAAKNYGCRVTTTTISKEQHDFAVQRIEQEGLQDRITVLFSDYRDLEGQYDKLVSIEMIEAVGHEYYRSYFEKCASLLKPEGLMLIQAITIPDQRYDMARKSVDFIQRYIFPGGCLPSVAVIADHVRKYTDLSIVGLEDITEHYARTLSMWRDRFNARLEQVARQGFDDVFVRMWEFYLCYCEGGFRERSIGTAQIVFAKPACRIVPVLGKL